jgi:hypothetical protein
MEFAERAAIEVSVRGTQLRSVVGVQSRVMQGPE